MPFNSSFNPYLLFPFHQYFSIAQSVSEQLEAFAAKHPDQVEILVGGSNENVVMEEPRNARGRFYQAFRNRPGAMYDKFL